MSWEQVLEKIRAGSVLALTLAQWEMLAGQTAYAATAHILPGATSTRTISGSGFSKSPGTEWALYWAQRLMAAHSVLRSWMVTNAYATTLPLSTILSSYSLGAQSVMDSYAAICALMLLEDMP